MGAVSEVGTAIDPGSGREPLGWRTVALVALAYVACVLVATYPVVRTFGSALPGSLLDPLQHLWILRWYKSCLLEGRSPLLCPEIQYPIGAPIGNFSPLHFQALLFIPLSMLLGNDVLCFNMIWLFGMVTTGLGTFVLIWYVLGHRGCAAFGGMLAMLSGPMMIHARAHLELVHLGSFPLFLAGWMHFVDKPDKRRLAVAVALYLLLALCAAYYMVFAIVPAALYAARGLLRPTRAERRDWARSRSGWLAAFAVLALPPLALVFGGHIWSSANGYAMERPVSEFAGFGTKLWTYVVPSSLHRANAVMPVANVYASAGYTIETVGERISYLGVVTLILLHQAAVRGVRFAGRGYWWTCLILLLVLSCGAYWEIGGRQIPLPGLWLKDHVPAFKMIRVPARFNLFVAVVAALVAAAGLRALLDRTRTRAGRAVLFGSLGALALFDLSTVPFSAFTIPEMPSVYADLRGEDPDATFLEIPQASSGGSHLSSLAAYWQSHHRGVTNVGYSGHGNLKFDNLLTWNSPFRAELLADPNYLAGPAMPTLGIVTEANFNDYAWLYLQVHGFRYVVAHRDPRVVPQGAARLDRLEARLGAAKIREDSKVLVFDRDLLPAPTRPTLMTTEGWRPGWHDKPMHVFAREGKFVAYIPDPNQPVRFAVEAKGLRRPVPVRLMAGGRELASWWIPADHYQLAVSEPLTFPKGLNELSLVCDHVVEPDRPGEPALEWDTEPYSLRVAGATLVIASGPGAEEPLQAPRIAAEPQPGAVR